MSEIKTVSVIGMGYIGLPTAVVLATRGIRVTGVDVNPRVVDAIAHGKVPFVEPRSVATVPIGVTRSSRWRRETPLSSTTMSASSTQVTMSRSSLVLHVQPAEVAGDALVQGLLELLDTGDGRGLGIGQADDLEGLGDLAPVGGRQRYERASTGEPASSGTGRGAAAG